MLLNFSMDNPSQPRQPEPSDTEIAPGTPPARARNRNGNATTRPSQSQSRSNHLRQPRPKLMSNYNAFQTTCSVATDAPPNYATATRPRPRKPSLEGREQLPGYSCTVEFGAKVLFNLESVNPLSFAGDAEWRDVYALVRGTMLNIYRVKDGGAGKLLRSYTLQHAEVGLASDVEFSKLVPQTKLAHLIPHSARRRAWTKDAALFRDVKQTVLRLRAEAHQILLADVHEDRIWSLMHAISAAIDISQPIDDRSIPRPCTVPRRRNRRQHRANHATGIDINDPIMLAEQERIFSQMFPRFAQRLREEAALEEAASQTDEPAETVEAPQTPAREEEEIDISEMREDNAASARPHSGDGRHGPSASRTTTNDTVNSAFSEDMMYVTSPDNFSCTGKWRPAQTRSAAQLSRYIRRCMPVLLADAPRASDIIICQGKRMKINARMELLEEWELQPPSYKAHNFHKESGLVRNVSQRSATGSANPAAPQSSSSVLAPSDDDHIAHVEQVIESHPRLSKITTTSTMDKSAPSRATLRAMADVDPKGRTPAQLAQDMQGVVLCF